MGKGLDIYLTSDEMSHLFRKGLKTMIDEVSGGDKFVVLKPDEVDIKVTKNTHEIDDADYDQIVQVGIVKILIPRKFSPDHQKNHYLNVCIANILIIYLMGLRKCMYAQYSPYAYLIVHYSHIRVFVAFCDIDRYNGKYFTR